MPSLLQNYFNFIRKCIPRKPEGSAIGLDVESNECRLVEIKKEGSEYKLISWSVKTFEKGNLPAAVNGILSSLKNPFDGVFSSIFGRGTLIRFISMPKMSIEDLRSCFAVEVDKYFPFPPDQIFTDCYIVDVNAKGKEMPVMVAAAKKEMVNERLDILKQLNIKTDFVGLNPIALVNAVTQLNQETGEASEAAAYLTIEETVSSLSIVLNGMPCFVRDIFIGGQDISKRIVNIMGVNTPDADVLRDTPGDHAQKVKEVSESLLLNILKEVRLSFDYFSTEHNTDVKKLYLTGSGSAFNGVQETFKENLDIPVEILSFLSGLVIDEKLNDENLKKNAHKLSVSIGLALYNYD